MPPIPAAISELSTTPGSNSPSGADSPSVLDDHQRTAYAFIRTLSDTKAATADVVLLAGAQTVPGIKTFSNGLIGNLTGNASGTAANVTGTVALANGGTGATTAAAAFTAIKQNATDTATGVVELATLLEAEAGTDTTRATTAAGIEAHMVANDLGWGQSWQDVTASRALATNYTNSTGRPIFVSVRLQQGAANAAASITVGGVIAARSSMTSSVGYEPNLSVVVPPSSTYSVSGTNFTLNVWAELR